MIRGKIKELIKRLKEIPGRRLFAALFVFCIAAAVVSAIVLINTHYGYKEARDEYAGLRGDTLQASDEDLAPEGSGSFLVLSTCTASEDDDERLLVFAAQG